MSKLKTYAKNILIALAAGFLSSLLTRGDIESFNSLIKPPLTPPDIVFPVVWAILYTLMGTGLSMVQLSGAPARIVNKAAFNYYIQLFFNFFWSIWFFKFQLLLFSFIWLVIMLFFIVLMTINFYKASKTAAFLQIPYILWVTFAGYLNFMYFLLN